MSRWHIDGNLIVDLDAFCAFGGRVAARSTFAVWGVRRNDGEVVMLAHYDSQEEAAKVLARIAAKITREAS